MMYTVNYTYGQENVQILFASIEDAFEAARAAKDAGFKASVGNTNDPDAVYMIPRK